MSGEQRRWMSRFSHPEWQRFRDDGEDCYLDITECGRMTIRPSPRGGYILRINSEIVGLFVTIEAAMNEAAARIGSMLAAKAEEDAWYEGWPKRKGP
jgi:hypothetical protein